jgi:hypothetical protein
MPTPDKQPAPQALEPEPPSAQPASEPEQEEQVESFSKEFENFFAHGLPDPSSWIGVGLDGTLAQLNGPLDPARIGEPVPNMVARVRDWTHRGHTVKVFTPRAADEAGQALVEQWLETHRLPELEVTCEKDLHMLELWDSRAVQIIANMGRPVGESRVEQPRQAVDNETLSQSDVKKAPQPGAAAQ